MRHFADGFNDGAVNAGIQQVADETAADLDEIHLEVLEVIEELEPLPFIQGLLLFFCESRQ